MKGPSLVGNWGQYDPGDKVNYGRKFAIFNRGTPSAQEGRLAQQLCSCEQINHLSRKRRSPESIPPV